LHLIGDGELKNDIEKEVQVRHLGEHVRFWGKRSDVSQLLSLFDAMVMPSFTEGLGVAALEAQAAGLPCLLSNGIPKEADINAGLCQYAALNKGVEHWQKLLLGLLKTEPTSKKILDELFLKGGYTLDTTRQTYIKAYR